VSIDDQRTSFWNHKRKQMADQLTPQLDLETPDVSDVDSSFLTGSEPEPSTSTPASPPSTPATPSTPPAEPAPTSPPPAAPPTSQPTSQQVSDALEQARELGVDVSRFSSGADLVRGMYEVVQNLQPYARIGQQAAANWDEFQAWKEQQRQQTHTPVEPQDGEFDLERHFQEAWGVPDWRREWTDAETRGYVEKDDRGNWKPAPGYEVAAAAVAQQMNEHDAARAQAIESLFVKGNPFKTIHDRLTPVLERRMEELAIQAVNQQYQQQQQQAYLRQVEQEFAAYERTPWGQTVLANVDRLRAAGMTDPMTLYQTATQLAGPKPDAAAPAVSPPAAAAQPAAAPTPITPDGQPQLPPLPTGFTYTVRDQSGRILSAEDVSRMQQQSFIDKASRASHVPGTANTPGDTQALRAANEAEMNSFFLDPQAP